MNFDYLVINIECIDSPDKYKDFSNHDMNIEEKFIDNKKKEQTFEKRRLDQKINWLWESVELKVDDCIDSKLKKNDLVHKIEKKIKSGEISFHTGSRLIFEILKRI